jgi:putative Holliday junction resolvase
VYDEDGEEEQLHLMAARILAIDFGLKRIGLAVSDALGITAQGLLTLQRTRLEDDLQRIRALVAEHGASWVIVGNPVSHVSGETMMSRQVASFVEKLRRHLACPVELWDERLTTAEANRLLRASGISIAKRRRARDRVAATLLLQSYLDYHANERARCERNGTGAL